MTQFKNSLVLTASICGIIMSLAMLLAWPFAHLSSSSALARETSNYVASIGILLLLISATGVFTMRTADGVHKVSSAGRLSPHAIASVILGFPLFGFMTWGLASLGGIVSGIIALKRISSSDEVSGRRLAIFGICLSFSTLPLLIIMILFLGP